MRRYSVIGLALGAALALGACDLDMTDPNFPSEDDVLSSPSGILQVAVGLQAEYSGQLIDPVYVAGLITDEIGAGGATFETYQTLDAKSGPLENNRDPSTAPWSGQYRVIQIANDLIENAPTVGLGAGTVSGIMALAELYKAMALGNLIQIYESIPVTVGPDNPDAVFLPRAEVLDSILGLLQSAETRIETTPPSSTFYDDVAAAGFDLGNTIDAMMARYALIAGNLSLAAQAAGEVNPSVLSEFRFSANDPNPLYVMWYSSGNAYQMRAEDQFRLDAEAGDLRVDYWVEEADIQGAVVALDDIPQYDEREDNYPVYLPDEMKLIRAEVAARQNDLVTAILLINQVRQQCPADTPLDEPAACLGPTTAVTQQQVLDEILRQRRYELYLQAVRWSDFRRFGVPLPSGYMWMPIPITECDRNENAPC